MYFVSLRRGRVLGLADVSRARSAGSTPYYLQYKFGRPLARYYSRTSGLRYLCQDPGSVILATASRARPGPVIHEPGRSLILALCPQRRLGTVSDVDLRKKRADMHLHRRLSYVQLGGDCTVREAGLEIF